MSVFLRLQDVVRARSRRPILPLLREAAQPGPSVRLLDVGGGTGAVTELFTAGCREVVVLEPDPKRVAYGQRRRPSLRFHAGQAEHLPFPDASFEVVVALVSFHHFADPDQAMREIRRVLTPSGRLVVEEFDPRRGKGKWLRHFGEHDRTLHTPERLRGRLEAQGFGVLRVTEDSLGYLVIASVRPLGTGPPSREA